MKCKWDNGEYALQLGLSEPFPMMISVPRPESNAVRLGNARYAYVYRKYWN